MALVSLSNINNAQTPSDKPLSFLDWSKRNVGVSFSDSQEQYKKYLSSFYKQVETDSIAANNKLREDYIDLIKKLQIIFQNDEEFERYKNIDLTSDTDLKIAIPVYAKKLKEIALFYMKKREELKHKKLEYNLIGSTDGLKTLLYSKLVSKFTKNSQTKFVNENPLITISPDFSAIAENLSIDIEELYDTTDYFNESDNLNPFACIFNNLCYNLITTPLSAKADPLEHNYLCEPSNESVNSLLQTAYNKYLGTDVHYVSGGYYVANYRDVNIPLEQGDNFFYWFSGTTVFDSPEGYYGDIHINDIDWKYATGAKSYSGSDVIITNVGNILTEGAWLYETDYVTVNATMSATIQDGKIFKFPFPDYGVSAIGGEWTGPTVNDTVPKNKRFFPTEEDFQNSENSLQKLYWNTSVTNSSVHPVLLQNTSLGSQGFASNNFNNADKVYVYNDTGSKTYYRGSPEIAWLYDFRRSQIPVRAGENKILFPILRYEEESDLVFPYSDGTAIPLSTINVNEAFVGAVGATTLTAADIIIKKASICGPDEEAAWLKAEPLRYYTNFDKEQCACGDDVSVYYTGWKYISGGSQAGISFKVDGGQTYRFIWTGETTPINNIRGFTGFEHDASCPYKNMDHSTSLVDENFLDDTNRELFEKWKSCTCQSIQHSPFGTLAADFETFKITPDFIVLETNFPTPFNKKSWTGTDGKDYRTSKDSARFFPSIIEQDVGWGAGYWKAQNGSDFILEKGKTYIYYRARTNNCSFDSPLFTINQGYTNVTVSNDSCEKISSIPQWTKAVLNESGEWVDAGVPSDMILEFGDFIVYNHRENITDTQSKLIYSGLDISTLSGDLVTLNPSDSNISYLTVESTRPSVNFLIKIPFNEPNRFWGHASGDKSSTEITRLLPTNGFNYRIVDDYLQITQPDPSLISLDNTKILEYRTSPNSTGCFVWEEPLKFEVYNPIKQWNKIVFDKCVTSEILSYLNSEIYNCYQSYYTCYSRCNEIVACGAEYFCNPTKTGVTATYVESDMILNTQLSGVPMFVNYYAQNTFVQNLSVHDITDGEQVLLVPVVTGEFIESSTPWRNLLNINGSNFVVADDVTNLKSSQELGFYIPSRIGMNRFETHDSEFYFEENDSESIKTYRVDNFFDNPFCKKRSNSKYVTDFSLGKSQGNIVNDSRQSFIPYTNMNESCDREYYGLYEDLIFSPWNQQTGEWDASDAYKNFRNQYNVKCSNDWFTNQLNLSGDVWNWSTDVYGNEYYNLFDENLDYLDEPSTYGEGYIKMLNGKVYPLSIALSSVFTKYYNINL